ncbi:exoribonuclease family protein [Paraphoma chrysanthemicola]|nr:exoribonuclease family protein [Paraphoma chrysanthemicola]
MATAPPEQQQQPPSLTFPRPIFAAVSPHPFLQAHLSANKTIAVRPNGRTAQMFRKPGINTGSLTHANGSAVVRLGNTSVVCGVRAEILREEDVPGTNEFHIPTSLETNTEEEDGEEDDSEEIDTLRLVVPNVELSTGSTPAHIPGNAPSSTQQSLITRLRSLILSTRLLRASDLRILYKPSMNALDDDADDEAQIVVKAYWVLYVDIFFISIDGSAFDAAWMSLLAALRDTKLPRAWWDEEYEGILCSDAPSEAKWLRLRGCPVAATFAVLESNSEGIGAEGEEEKGEWVLSDPDAFEESVCRESVTVVVDGRWDKGGKGAMVRRIEKSGGGVVGRQEAEGMRTVIRRAVVRWSDVKTVLEGQ